MLPRIGQRFLYNAEELKLDQRAQLDLVGHGHAGSHAALRLPPRDELLERLLERPSRSHLRAESQDSLARIRIGEPGRFGQLVQLLAGIHRPAGLDVGFHRLRLGIHVGENLRHAVVDLAADSSALLGDGV